MLFTELLKMAGLSLVANKLRTVLTMLGIIIGVSAVIALVSVGMGVRKNVTDSISRLGSNLLMVMSGSSNRGGVRGGAGSVQTLTYDDAKAFHRQLKVHIKWFMGTKIGVQQLPALFRNMRRFNL